MYQLGQEFEKIEPFFFKLQTTLNWTDLYSSYTFPCLFTSLLKEFKNSGHDKSFTTVEMGKNIKRQMFIYIT